MVKPKLRIHGYTRRIRAVGVGDTVFIVRSLAGVPLDTISAFPAPFIVAIDQGGTGKRGQAFRFKVQFQTRERQTHVGFFWSRHLKATKKVLGIGARVVVRQQLPEVMVPVGTEGTVVGGDGHTYHITFFIDKFEPPITVSQDGVPSDALGLPGQDNAPVSDDEEGEVEGEGGEGGEGDIEPSEVVESDGEVVVEERRGTRADPTEDEDEGEVVEEQQEEELPVAPSELLSPHLRAALLLHLQPEQVDMLCAHLQHQNVTRVDDALTLQGYLATFLRVQQSGGNSSGHDQELPPAHVIALQQAGVSDADMHRLAQDGVTARLTPGAAVKRYLKIKR